MSEITNKKQDKNASRMVEMMCTMCVAMEMEKFMDQFLCALR